YQSNLRTRSPRLEDDIPIAPSLYSLSNKMDNSLLAVRDINHKYIVVEGKEVCIMKKQLKKKVTVASKQHVMAHCSCTCSCSLNNNYNASWGKVNYHYI
ncbi:MAG: hypothetical protein U0N20_13620, partial [Clostridium sp.]